MKPEVAEKVLDARARWKSRWVQVLVVEDLPEDHREVLELERVEHVLGSMDVPTRVYVQGTRYVIRLRERIPRDQYLEVLDRLRSLDPDAGWDSSAGGIVLTRAEEIPEEERLDVMEIVVAPKGVKA